jgi:ribosomal protein L11 methyltransferase
MQHFHPMRFGARLWICPSWQAPPAPDAVNILLDPGLAFGTGTHPTTALCLEWVDQHGADYDEVIDYGCGSGILALAAAKLGARHVWAVDNDPQALLATRANAANNGVAHLIDAVTPQALPALRTQLLLANILAQPLIDLADRFSAYVSPGGYIVLSGILTQQAASVAAAYQKHFEMAPWVGKDEWIRLVGKKRLQEGPVIHP